MTQCLEPEIMNPFTGKELNLSRAELGTVVTFMDMMCVIIFILAVIFMDRIS